MRFDRAVADAEFRGDPLVLKASREKPQNLPFAVRQARQFRALCETGLRAPDGGVERPARQGKLDEIGGAGLYEFGYEGRADPAARIDDGQRETVQRQVGNACRRRMVVFDVDQDAASARWNAEASERAVDLALVSPSDVDPIWSPSLTRR